MKKIFFLSLLTIIVPIHPQSSNEWITHFEKSGFLSTPHYNESMKYFENLAAASPYAEFNTFGTSPQGRKLNYIVVSKDKVFDPVSARATGKPVLMIVNGIHSGEIGGKDACMILLRDILITKEKLKFIDNVILLIVPVFNVDGHERMSKYNRINQNGPEEMGWRTTSQNLNLNRDWLKAEAPEMKAMINLFALWMPDFLIDTHATDGADYQCTVTYSVEKFANICSGTADWLKNKYIPSLEKSVYEKGFLVYPYVYLKDWSKGFDGGIMDWAASPRFSTGYAALQNRPSLLIETHMIKAYKERVYSTKAMIEATLEFLNVHPDELVKLNKQADEKTLEKFVTKNDYLPVSFKSSEKFDEINFKGFRYYWDSSYISGTNKIVYTNEKIDLRLKYYNDVVATDSVKLPKAYIIPKEWESLVNIIKMHGIQVEILKFDTTCEVTKYRFKKVKFSNSSYEGRQQVDFDYDSFTDKQSVTSGTFYIPVDQRTLRIIANLLEPASDDSFIKWGYMNPVFEQKEYFENYVMEKVAQKMIENDIELKDEFETRLGDNDEFKKDANARLNFFYERSPYYDNHFNVYPVMRVE